MASSLHVPIACRSCDRAWLAPPTLQPPPECPRCHQPAEVVPGESYTAADTELFERIERVVHARQLGRGTAQQLWTTVGDVTTRTRRPELLLLTVVDAMPLLQFLQLELGRDRAQLARAVGMVQAVLTAHLRALQLHESSPAPRATAAPAR